MDKARLSGGIARCGATSTTRLPAGDGQVRDMQEGRPECTKPVIVSEHCHWLRNPVFLMDKTSSCIAQPTSRRCCIAGTIRRSAHTSRKNANPVAALLHRDEDAKLVTPAFLTKSKKSIWTPLKKPPKMRSQE
jgi:hypothetical protein